MGKFFRGAPANKVNAEKTAEKTNKNGVGKAKGKNNKKNKISKPAVLATAEIKSNGVIPKKDKKETPLVTPTEIVNNPSPKKAKKNKNSITPSVISTETNNVVSPPKENKKIKTTPQKQIPLVAPTEGNALSPKKGKENKNTETPSLTAETLINATSPKKAKKNKKNKNKNKIVETAESTENMAKKMKFAEMYDAESDIGKPKAKKAKKEEAENPDSDNEDETPVKKEKTEVAYGNAGLKGITEEMMAQYPVLKNEEAIKKFRSVSLKNNQKGRIRQQLKQKLKGTSEAMRPDAINSQITALLKSDNPNLHKGRVLFNMLVMALRETKRPVKKEKPVPKEKKEKKEKGVEKKEKPEGTEKPEQKVKGPKRYVVFIGNLPLDITKEKILEHFSDLSDKIKDVRIPKPLENRKSMIAYLEVADELTYELSLSKHHTMLDNRRINVLYSTQKDTKITKAEAKGKAAKLVAMQKSGQLAGSAPLSKKRSARRKKMKQAQKMAQEAAERGV